jgi:hypothetical protein
MIAAFVVVIATAAAFVAIAYLRAPSADHAFGVITNPDDAPENWRYEPLRGARVLAVWQEEVPRDDHPSTQQLCLRAEYTRTRDDGSIHLDGWWLKPRWPLARKIRVVHSVAEPGYRRELWLNGKWPAPSSFDSFSFVAREEDPSNPLPILTPRELLGCLEAPIERR